MAPDSSDRVDPLTPTVAATLPDAPATDAREGDAIGGYSVRRLLGRGGMGEVMLAHDASIGREVALKRIRSTAPSDEHLARFIREARIQARLDHPAIVPVYAIGTDDAGRPYFTMKRLAGTTLHELLTRGETLQRLLRGLVDVCLAIEFAHSRRVVHRDIKPSNIMLGDYGEVYVLDWGVARVLTDPDDARSSADDIPSLGGGSETSTGSLLGTPGYMAPEQVLGQEVTTATDVYALGAILFELLASDPLHPRGTAAIASTLSAHDRSPAKRAPARGIAPELDALCSQALDPDPARRPTARELANGLQAYLDGDRDVERRRLHAAELVTTARAALDGGDRSEAFRVAGQALVFDPSSADARELVRTLLVEAPTEVPAQLLPTILEEERMAARKRSRRAIRPYASLFVLIPLIPFIEIRSWPSLIMLNIAALLGVAMAWWNVRRGLPLPIILAIHVIIVISFSRIAGPLILTPLLIATTLLSVTSMPWLIERKWAVVGWTIVAAMAPYVLELAGVLGPTWSIGEEGVITFGRIFRPTESFNLALTISSNVAAIVVVALYSLTMSRDRRDAERRQRVQAWQLEQILPRRPRTVNAG